MNDKALEFFKLDANDKKILFWIMDHDPKVIAEWTKEIARQYKMRSIHIDAEKLLSEVKLELPNPC